MASGKRYFWLKLKEDFFSAKEIKKLRRIAGGDTYTIIYLKMQLLSLKNGGVLEYAGLESSFAEELALDLDENTDDVSVTMQYLIGCGLAEQGNSDLLLPAVVENTGSEGASAQRVRDFRKRELEKITGVTPSVLQSNASSLQRNNSVTERKSKSKRKNKSESKSMADKPPRTRFTPPTVEEVKAYCSERNNGIDAQRFVDYYTANGWTQGKGKPIKDWKAAVRTWEHNGTGKANIRTPNDYYNYDGGNSL